MADDHEHDLRGRGVRVDLDDRSTPPGQSPNRWVSILCPMSAWPSLDLKEPAVIIARARMPIREGEFVGDVSVPFSVLSGEGGGDLGSQRIERFGARRCYPIPRGGERGHYRGGSENAAVVGEEGSGVRGRPGLVGSKERSSPTLLSKRPSWLV